MNDEQILQRIRSSRTPFSIACETTNICSANCAFCAYGKGGDQRPKGRIDRAVLDHLLSLVGKGGQEYTLSINTILGDPTCDDRWIDHVRAARATRNVGTIRAFTNAILLDKFDPNELLASGLSHLTLSTSLADADSYKRIYGVDQYDRVVANILRLNKANAELGKPVHINVALRMDQPEEPFFQSPLYKELTRYVSEGKISTLDTYDDWGGLVKKADLPRGASFIKSWTGQANPHDRSVPCYGLYRTLQLLYDGTIQGCTCRVNPDLAAGNITDFGSIEDAWRNTRFDELRQAWWDGEVPKYCRRCSHYHPMTTLVEKFRNNRPSTWKRMRRSLAKLLGTRA